MDIQKRSAGIGAAILIFAVLLRLLDSALVLPAYARHAEAEKQSIARLPASALSAATSYPKPETTVPTMPSTIVPIPTVPVPEVPERLRFTAADAQYLRLRTATDCGYYPNLEQLLLLPLVWELDNGEPTVLIYHSHACEAYTKDGGETYTELINCRTTDPAYNMIAVGRQLASLLEEAGIRVIHDLQLHDEHSYSAAYVHSRLSVEEYLKQYPSIRLVLDLHRDAAVNTDGSRYATAAVVDGQPAAQLMLVMGTDYTGSYHPDWEENLSIALKLQALMEQNCPGITRPTSLRGSRFNQDMHPGALLIEVGASGNTRQQIARSIPVLADAIIALAQGTI